MHTTLSPNDAVWIFTFFYLALNKTPYALTPKIVLCLLEKSGSNKVFPLGSALHSMRLSLLSSNFLNLFLLLPLHYLSHSLSICLLHYFTYFGYANKRQCAIARFHDALLRLTNNFQCYINLSGYVLLLFLSIWLVVLPTTQ